MIKCINTGSIRLTKADQEALNKKAGDNGLASVKVTDEDTLIEANITAMSESAIAWISDKLEMKPVK